MYYDTHFITCHRVSPQEERRGTDKRENQRQKQGKRTESGAEESGHTREASPEPERGNGRKRHETDKEKTVLCRVGSELPLVPASLCHSIRQEEDFVLEILTA